MQKTEAEHNGVLYEITLEGLATPIVGVLVGEGIFILDVDTKVWNWFPRGSVVGFDQVHMPSRNHVFNNALEQLKSKR